MNRMSTFKVASLKRHPTPDLRSDPPHRGEGKGGSGVLTSPFDGGGRTEGAGGGEHSSPRKIAIFEFWKPLEGRSYYA